MEFKFRDLKSHCVPTGPNFARAKPVVIDFSGTRVSMRLNRHLPVAGYEQEHKPASRYDLFNPSGYEPSELSSLDYQHLLHRDWAFRGPLLTGHVAQLELTIQLHRIKLPNERFSLFNPEHLEAQVLRQLTEECGQKFRNGRCEKTAPVDWCPHHHVPVPSVSCLVIPNFVGDRRKRFMLPL